MAFVPTGYPPIRPSINGTAQDVYKRQGYHLVFVNGSPRTIDKLNEAKKYTIFTSSPEGVTSRVITGFEAYSLSLIHISFP